MDDLIEQMNYDEEQGDFDEEEEDEVEDFDRVVEKKAAK